MFLLHLSSAHAGYADAVDGLPTHAERETFLWTNAVRIDPAAFQADYPCDFSSFAGDEQTTKPLLWHSEGLTAAADHHSTDMAVDGYFAHDSNDGTPWDERIRRFYSGSWIGENIAWGYNSPFSAVIEGWMCSGGHRSNIMSDDFEELGAGVSGVYWTQDFGTGSDPSRVMAMGIHLPAAPTTEVVLAVDLQVPQAIDAVYAVLDGARVDLSRLIGTDTRGLWLETVPVADLGCHEYYFVAEDGGFVETWPETGSYGWGPCAFDDPGAGWLASQEPRPVDEPGADDTSDPTGAPADTGDPGAEGGTTVPVGTGTAATDAEASQLAGGCGCGTSGGGGVGALAAIGALLVGRRGGGGRASVR